MIRGDVWTIYNPELDDRDSSAARALVRAVNDAFATAART